jgi:hypothetical protein
MRSAATRLRAATRPSWERPHALPGNVAFGVGQPSFDLLPTAMVRRAAAELFAPGGGDPRESLQYADTRGTVGESPRFLMP